MEGIIVGYAMCYVNRPKTESRSNQLAAGSYIMSQSNSYPRSCTYQVRNSMWGNVNYTEVQNTTADVNFSAR
jgi:hypothetical protein